MADLIKHAEEYAIQAHNQVNHRRKYTNHSYDVHLKATAMLVASVTKDPEMIAAAWLHDSVEDTLATLDDIQAEFGKGVAGLVEELTDVSRPGDGNRAIRKEVDLRHTARISARAKSIKLADLIDNCRDITKHDPKFSRIYLTEMGRLLEVLADGDRALSTCTRGIYEGLGKDRITIVLLRSGLKKKIKHPNGKETAHRNGYSYQFHCREAYEA